MTSPLQLLPLWLAHTGAPEAGPENWSELARAWELEPLVVLLLIASAWGYRRGVRRLRREVGPGRGLQRWEIACYWAGWWSLVIAIASPLHPWGQVLFSAHMTQHELLMLVAAPLLVLGRPVVAFLFALPREDAREWSRLARAPRFQAFWRWLTQPLVAWIIHAVALWTWHVPALFQAALRSEGVHHFQHACFFGSALLFWWSLLHHRASLANAGAALLYLFTTMLHSGLLGAGLAFASQIIYPAYGDASLSWSLTPREDQQLGGFIMWIPAGIVYVIAALALLAGWLRHAHGSLSARPFLPPADGQQVTY
jgi:putative membrane protein